MCPSYRVLVLAVLACLAGSEQALADLWSPEFFLTGPSGPVTAIVEWQGSLVVGGRFDAIGDVPINRIARRLGATSWQQLGPTLPIRRVLDLCEHDGSLHLLGMDTDPGACCVWRLDGEVWTAIGGPLPATVLASYDGALHAGGYRWQDGVWVDVLAVNDDVLDLVVREDLLIAGGSFTASGELDTGHVLAWDGAQVLAAFPGQDCEVTGLAIYHDELYAGRDVAAGASCVQVWRDGGWVDVPALGQADHRRTVSALTVSRDRLAVGTVELQGEYPLADESLVLAWDGAAAEVLYHNDDDGCLVFAIFEDDRGLLLGGAFLQPGDPPCYNLGYWQDQVMEPICPVGLGCSGHVGMFCAGDQGLAVGGAYWAIGGLWSHNVAVSAATGWAARDLEMSVAGLAWHQGLLRGVFADLDATIYDGRWEAGAWQLQPFTGYLPGGLELQSWDGQLLYLGIDGAVYAIEDPGIAVPFLTPDPGSVRDLDVLDGDLIAGGSFAAIDGVLAANVARYDGVSWQAIGDGLPSAVESVGSWRGQPVVARMSLEYSGQVISAWDGETWQDLGLVSGPVYAPLVLQDYRDLLYVGGEFATVDGQPLANLACWTGSAWGSIGEVDRPVAALAVHDDLLWVGGSFRSAGGLPAAGICFYTTGDLDVPPGDLPAQLTLTLAAAPNPFNPVATLRFRLPAAGRAMLEAFDVAGRRVGVILNDDLAAGEHTVDWNGVDARGRSLPSGTYLVRLRAAGQVITTRAALVR